MRRDEEEMLTPQQIAALKNIEKIVRDIFDPGKEHIEKLIRDNGPERALVILNLAARFSASLKRVH